MDLAEKEADQSEDVIPKPRDAIGRSTFSMMRMKSKENTNGKKGGADFRRLFANEKRFLDGIFCK